MTTREPHRTDTTPALTPLASRLEQVAEQLGVKSVLVMRSEPDSMVVAATAGEATKHYTVGAAGKKAVVGTVCVLDDSARDYTPAQRAEISQLRDDVEAIVRRDDTALS